MTIKELREQKEELEKQIKEAEERELSQKQQIVLEKINNLSNEDREFILKFIEHDRTSCSDDHVNNGYGSADYGARCRKCHLIEILNGKHGGEFDFSFDVNIWKV